MASDRNTWYQSTAYPASSAPQYSSQHVYRATHRGGQWTGEQPDYGHYNTGASTTSQFQEWQGQNSSINHRPDFQANEGQWNQRWQQNETYNSSGYSPAQPAPQQQPSYNAAFPQSHSWSQQYPQYGHINPAFLPRQPVAQTQYPATDTPNGGYGGFDSSFGPAHNGRQRSGYGTSYQSNQIPVANSQAPSAAASYPANYYAQKSLVQAQAQLSNQPAWDHTTHFIKDQIPANPTDFSEAARYGNGFPPQLECLMNPEYMNPKLTATGENPRQYLLPCPQPSESYLECANRPPRRLSSPKKLLIVLDLNGTLLVRSNRGSKYTPRPFVQKFLVYCLENHLLVVWSSARPHNVSPMVAQLFTPEQHAKLVKVWSRDHLRLGVHFNAKVQVYKRLTWLWEDSEVQASFPSAPFKVEDGWKEPPLTTMWDQTNTVLLDDSTEKAASEPFNLLRVDEFTQANKKDGDDVLGRVLVYLEDLKREADVSAAMRERPFVNKEGAEWDWEKGERRPSA